MSVGVTIHPSRVEEARRLLDQAPHGMRTELIGDIARTWGVSVSQAYSHLKRGGWASGRKRRVDAGRSMRITPLELHRMSEWLYLSQRKTGTILGDIAAGKQVLYASGQISESAHAASDTTWNRLLTDHGLSKTHLKAASLATELDSRYPNQWHLVDASIGVLFYIDKGAMKFKQFDLMDPKNKPQQFAQWVHRRLMLIRWVLVDHYSGAFVVRYAHSTGETAADLIDFLHYAWSPKPNPRIWPMMGACEHLYLDQASAQKSSYMESLTKALGIKLHLHQASGKRTDASAARATGGVEVIQRVWEHEFEVMWRSNPPTGGIEQINRQAADFCPVMNGDERFRLERAKMTRSELWLDITDEQLRMPPADLDAFRSLACSQPLSRKLDAYGRIELDGSHFKIYGCTWYPKETLEVRRNPFDADVVQVTCPRTGETLEARRQTVKRNGRSTDAVYLGEEDETGHARQPLHAAARLRRQVAQEITDQTGLSTPGLLVTPLEHASETLKVDFVPRAGTPIIPQLSGRLVDLWDTLDLAKARFGELTEEHSAWLTERVKKHIDELEALALIEELAGIQGQTRQVLTFGRTRT